MSEKYFEEAPFYSTMVIATLMASRMRTVVVVVVVLVIIIHLPDYTRYLLVIVEN